jgi:hypothetical protein
MVKVNRSSGVIMFLNIESVCCCKLITPIILDNYGTTIFNCFSSISVPKVPTVCCMTYNWINTISTNTDV